MELAAADSKTRWCGDPKVHGPSIRAAFDPIAMCLM